jgi:hypothetical protein
VASLSKQVYPLLSHLRGKKVLLVTC